VAFELRGAGWRGLGEDPNCTGEILVVVDVGDDRKFLLGTATADVEEVVGGEKMHFADAILNNPSFSDEVDVFDRSIRRARSMSFDVAADHFPIPDLRRTGALLQDSTVDVYWYVANRGFALNQALHVLRGKLTTPHYDEERKISSFGVEEGSLEENIPFPPIVATSDLISTLDDEFSGKPYPVIIGSVKKTPTLKIAADAKSWLIAYDRLNEHGSMPIAGAYDGDDGTALGAIATSSATDSAGNSYIKLTTANAASTKDVTADVQGHTPATVDEAIRYLLTFFGSAANRFDLSTLSDLGRVFSAIELGLIFNQRGVGGVLQNILNRLMRQLPFASVQVGEQYEFMPISWDRDVVKTLSYGKNIVRKISGPTETPRSDIFNSFVVKYARSGLRGDHTGCIVRDHDTDQACRLSKLWHGSRAMPDFDAGDVSNDAGAMYIMNWLIETFSKMRVFVSYECTLDVVGTWMLDTVRVIDDKEGWDTEFKVIGIELPPNSPTVGLSLVSVGDYVEVYDVNRSLESDPPI